MDATRTAGLPARSCTLMVKATVPCVDPATTVVAAVHVDGPPVDATKTPSSVTFGANNSVSLTVNVSVTELLVVANELLKALFEVIVAGDTTGLVLSAKHTRLRTAVRAQTAQCTNVPTVTELPSVVPAVEAPLPARSVTEMEKVTAVSGVPAVTDAVADHAKGPPVGTTVPPISVTEGVESAVSEIVKDRVTTSLSLASDVTPLLDCTRTGVMDGAVVSAKA